MNGSFGYEIRYIRQLRKLHRFHTAHAVLALCFFFKYIIYLFTGKSILEYFVQCIYIKIYYGKLSYPRVL